MYIHIKEKIMENREMTTIDFINLARTVVAKYSKDKLGLDIGQFNVHVAATSKTLQNFKGQFITSSRDGRYYEVTYNGNTGETYLDVYKKEANIVEANIVYKNVKEVEL